ncbi:hypothetical protein CHARACLAT_019701 [Characodon lateralis]|uniref:Calnexin n=1 Tax=Characodon lateralis TaxID=208331 RepID=A0ABU7DSI1_9TELE|nr:hypothetical protein [Characodon lateralis]
MLNAAEERPWLWIVYVLTVALPLVLIVVFCCTGKDKKKSPAAEYKKTDEPQPDVKEEEEEEGGEEKTEEAKNSSEDKSDEEVAAAEEEDGEKEATTDEKEDDILRRSPRSRKISNFSVFLLLKRSVVQTERQESQKNTWMFESAATGRLFLLLYPAPASFSTSSPPPGQQARRTKTQRLTATGRRRISCCSPDRCCRESGLLHFHMSAAVTEGR